MKNDTIVVQRNFNAPVQKVWQAITSLEQMKRWYFNTLQAFEPVPGFETQFDVHHEGKTFVHIWKVTEVIPMKKIAYEWKYGGYPGNSLVSFELAAAGDTTSLTLTHSGIESFMPVAYPESAAINFTEGWTAFIGTLLKDFVEAA